MTYRRTMVTFLVGLMGVAAGCNEQPNATAPAQPRSTDGVAENQHMKTDKTYPVVKSDEQWRAQLTKEQYRITRKKGTERAFANAYWDNKKVGTYHCICCDAPLYSSETKFESGTGWPSYWQPISPDAVETEADRSLFMTRTELLCSQCGAHLGHVFPDGPPPTGQRHCLNSASLKFVEKK